MKPRTFTLLLVAAVVVAVVALWTQRSREAATAFMPGGEVFLPPLAASINEVRRVHLRSAEDELVLERGPEGWVIASRGGYPASFEEVKGLLVGLSRLETREPKTSRPELYGQLGVGDVDEGGSGTLVRVEAGDDEVLAEVVIGEERVGRGGDDEAVYARRAGEERSWLLDGSVDVGTQPNEWADAEILSIPEARIQRVEVVHPDGERLVVSKESESDGSFTVEDVPEGRELKSPRIASPLAGALGYLNWSDVRPAGEVELDGPTATFRTFAGLRVVARADTDEEADVGLLALEVGVDEDYLAQRRAELEYELAGARELAEELAAEQAAFAEAQPDGEEGAGTAGDGDATDAPTEDGGEATVPPVEDPEEVAGVGLAQSRLDDFEERVEEVREEAATLASKVAGWVYEVSRYKVQNLDKRMEDMLAPPPEPEDAGPPAPGPEPATTPPDEVGAHDGTAEQAGASADGDAADGDDGV